MTLAMPRVVQMPSPNYTPVAIRHDLVVLHMMEGTYEGSRVWLCDPRAKASAHLCLKADGSEVTQLVPLSYKAWAQCAFNACGLSIEIEGFTAHGLTDAAFRASALLAAWICLAYGVPPVWAQGGQGRGVCCHHDLGRAGGGHVDICGVGDAAWVRMMGAIQGAYDELRGLPALPDFALHGLPGPHQIATPPAAAPAPSHGGAARHEPGDAHAHPTGSGFPHGSVADLQWRLNRAGVEPRLRVDGWFGTKTSGALQRFQAAHGRAASDRLGPETWLLLDRLTAA